MQNIRKFLEHAPQLGRDVFVDLAAVVTGQVSLGDDVSVWPNVSIRGDLMPIQIGNRSNIQDNCVIHTSHDSEFYAGAACTIGEDVTVGHGAILHGCTIEDRVLIGMNAVVLDRSVIPSEVIIGAGSLVPPGKTLESGYLYVGAPAKKARPLTDTEKAYFTYSAAHYIKLKNQHMTGLEK